MGLAFGIDVSGFVDEVAQVSRQTAVRTFRL